MDRAIDFFLGASAPGGFFHCFAQAYPPFESGDVLLLKGGPGCGKSTMLRALAGALAERGCLVERIRCAQAPEALDGVVCAQRAFAAFDATAPHALEPRYPGAYEQVVSLHGAYRAGALREKRDALRALTLLEEKERQRAVRYLTAAGCLVHDTARTALCGTDTAKARRFAHTLARRYLPATAQKGAEHVRMLSAVGPDGAVFLSDTVRALADTVVVLDDAWGAAGPALLGELRALALERGHTFYACRCPLHPRDKLEHLLFPALRLAFVTASPFHPVSFPGQRTLHAQRFTNRDALALRRNRLRFNRRSAEELLAQAAGALRAARDAHREIEAVYSAALDTQALDALTGALVRRWCC